MRDEYRSIPSNISSLRHYINEYLVNEMKKAGWKGISPSHGGIIYILLYHEVLSMKEIAHKVKRDPSTVTTLVNKLVKLGYAEFERNPEDLRSKQVRLTEEGKKLYDDFHDISESLMVDLLKGIPDDEIDGFLLTVKKMKDNLKKA